MNTAIKHVILGTGPLGLAIMDELVAQGHTPTLVNRSGRLSEQLPAGVILTTADLTQSSEVARVTQNADIVFFCAQPAYHQWPEKFPPLIQSLIDGVAQTGAKIVFGSNTYMYGATNGALLTEDLPYTAETRKGRTRAKMAHMLLEAHKTGRVQVTIGRASDFYGPRVKGSAVGETLFEAAVTHKTADLAGKLDLPHTYTYIRDFARALVTLSQNDKAYGRAWHVPSAETLTTSQFIQLIEADLGHPVKVRTAGKLLLWLVGRFKPEVNEMIEMLYEFEEPYIVDHSQFAAAFGTHTTPHTQAIAETIAWYKHHQREETTITTIAEPSPSPSPRLT